MNAYEQSSHLSDVEARLSQDETETDLSASVLIPKFTAVGLGCSAGGLETCTGLLQAVAEETCAFPFVGQHLDPHHESLLAALLTVQSSRTAKRAAYDKPVQKNQLYFISPASSLTITAKLVHLTTALDNWGARLPFDTLLRSLAKDCGDPACCEVRSATGSDELWVIRAAGGTNVVRDPADAASGGMPRAATATGLVNATVQAFDIPAVFVWAAADGLAVLRVAPGFATPNLLGMTRGAMRTRLRSALNDAASGARPVCVLGERTVQDGRAVPVTIEVQPLSSDGEALLLVCSIDQPRPRSSVRQDFRNASRVAELEREHDTARADQDAAHLTIEAPGEVQRAVKDEALSVNDKHQSTTEELLTSQKELQSLNQELRALNSQLQETLDRQRTTANDMQNTLFSTGVATLVLDRGLNIRFYTPATKALFNFIPGDVGRPLADLHLPAIDTALPADAQSVLTSLHPIEREIETPGATWFRRRILPYRTGKGPGGDSIAGVVITFENITRYKQEAQALQKAKREAEAANLAKSRLLAAASHDLRQPMQTLALLQGLLSHNVTGEKAAGLVQRLGETVRTMGGMLDTLLDPNQPKAGGVQAVIEDCPIGPVLQRSRDEFADPAEAKGLAPQIVPCIATVRTDPRPREQMLPNHVSNALKYTERDRVLLGRRRRADRVLIEVGDTGIGKPDQNLQAAFEQYHQVGNTVRERSRGLGLGLSTVRRLTILLSHRVRVQSQAGHGSIFSIEAMLASGAPTAQPHGTPRKSVQSAGTILVIEDDPDMRELLGLMLQEAGYRVAIAPSGLAAIDMVAGGAVRPGLVLADYNLPGGMTGLQAVATLRTSLPDVPVVILTGDLSAATLHDVVQAGCKPLNKPIKPDDLLQSIRALFSMPAALPVPTVPSQDGDPIIFVVDDDATLRAMLRGVLETNGYRVEDYAGGDAFLAAYRPGQEGCLLVDAAMPGMDGLEVLRRLTAAGHSLPGIVITGHGDVAMAVAAMKAGALDFIKKPVSVPDLLVEVLRALGRSHDANLRSASKAEAVSSMAGLTARQRDVMTMVLAGHPSKNIAADLGISQRTVENHRASIMRRTGTKSLPALARLAVAAASAGVDGPKLP